MPSTPLPIVADVPLTDPKLGFEKYAGALADAVRGGNPPQFTVGIYGPWGSGKSSLLNAIANNLAEDDEIFSVFFDAWRYERSDHIIVPLLHGIIAAIPEQEGTQLKSRLRKALLAIVQSITFQLGPLSLDPGRGVDAYLADDPKLDALDAVFSRPYQEMKAISQALNGRRIVVLIDDLDRCSSGNVVALLEAINLVMDVPGFIFVLALDYDVLVQAVAARYPHASGHVFIEKMVQVPVRVPRLDVKVDTFLEDLVPDVSGALSASVSKAFPEIAFDVARMALDFNPRQVKRFINSMLVLLRVAEEASPAIDVRLLAGVVGLQLRWPSEYREVADAVFEEIDSPTESLHSGNDGDLIVFAQSFLPPDLTSEVLQPVLRLTRVVVGLEVSAGSQILVEKVVPPAMAELREVNRDRIVQLLSSKNYSSSRRLSAAYYSPVTQGLRIVLGKTVVRFELRDRQGRWVNVLSFLLTRGTDDAIELISARKRLLPALKAASPSLYSLNFSEGRRA